MAGRPLGSREPVTLDLYLGLHHFAFLRSGAEGLNLAHAAERYMLGMERVDARTAKALERRLLRQVIAAAEALNDAAVSVQLEALASNNDPEPIGFVPSFEDFADDIDLDCPKSRSLACAAKAQHCAAHTQQPFIFYGWSANLIWRDLQRR